MSTTPPPREGRTSSLLMLATIVVSVAGLVTGCGGDETLEGAEAQVVPVVVRAVAEVDRPDYLALSGDVVGWRTVNVGFLVPGKVDSVGPSEGDEVGSGDLLAALDRTEYRLNVEMAEAHRERAADEHARAEAMFEANAIPENDYQKAVTALRLARAQAEVAAKKLADARLTAPMSGVVARRGIQPGEQAGPGVPVFTLVQVDRVQVQVGVPEAEIGRVAVGQRATLTVPALDDASFEGRVHIVGIAADPASRTYTTKIAVPNPRRVLRPGMIAEVRIEGDRMIQALTLPGEAIVRDVDGVTRVFVYFPNEERVHSRRVVTGSLFGREIEVREGLTGDELVVIGGQHRIREGSRVLAEEEPVPGEAASSDGSR
jgi:membrane fusion protein (multidrug efflux system)